MELGSPVGKNDGASSVQLEMIFCSSPCPPLSTIPLRTERQLRASSKSKLILIPLKSRQVKKVQMEELLKKCPEASSTGKKFLQGVRGRGSDGCRKEESGTHPRPFCSDVSGFSSSWNPKDSLNNNKICPFVQRTLNTKVKRTEPPPSRTHSPAPGNLTATRDCNPGVHLPILSELKAADLKTCP